MPATLVVTNDFPTRTGGIESFVLSLTNRLPAADVVVYTASMPGDTEYDAALPYPVVRDRTSMLLPTPRVARDVSAVLQHYGCERVVFGASAPLGLLAPALRRAGARRTVALTHGHEVWWGTVPGSRQLLHRIGEQNDVLTYVSNWCRDAITPALSDAAVQRMARLSPGVDVRRFRPGAGGAQTRERLGIGADRPVVVCVARMVARKGQDTLIRGLRRLRVEVPDVVLLLVGDGPYRKDLEELARAEQVQDSVLFTGSVPWEEVPAYIDAADVFAMPCRTRLGGLEPEAWGIVFLEAQACGVPVVVGDSGGAPETVRHGETGYVVDPHNPVAVAAKLAVLLGDPALRERMSTAGQAWAAEHTWDASAAVLRELLQG